MRAVSLDNAYELAVLLHWTPDVLRRVTLTEVNTWRLAYHRVHPPASQTDQ